MSQSLGAASLTLALAATGAPQARADDVVALAREIGFAYRYLPHDNAVSLYRPGAIVVVPFVRRNDVYLSRAFECEIRTLERLRSDLGARANEPAEASGVAIGSGAVASPESSAGNVATLVTVHDETHDAVVVRGRPTPGARVARAGVATLAKELPPVTLDRAVTYAAADGTYAATLSFGNATFSESHYAVEASGPQDRVPARAAVTRGSR